MAAAPSRCHGDEQMDLGCVLEAEWWEGYNQSLWFLDQSSDIWPAVCISVVWKLGVLQAILLDAGEDLRGPFQIHPQGGTKIHPEAKPWLLPESR